MEKLNIIISYFFIVGCGCGYVFNVLAIIAYDSGSVGMLVMRVIGTLLAPIGILLGYF